MSPFMGLNVLAVVGPRMVKPMAAQPGGVDAVMVFGFFAAFFTIVVLMYQQQLRTRLPLLVIGLVSLSVDGFLEGTWVLGFSLAALSASEFRHWCQNKRGRRLTLSGKPDCHTLLSNSESRVERMFGSL